MREKLNNVNFRKFSFITVMVANVIYLINIIICAIGFFNLDVSNQEQQWEKENGLLEYVATHTNEHILLTIAWLVFLLAGAFLYVSYILEKNGALKIVMMVCSIIVVVNYLLYLLLEFLAKVIVGGMGLFQLIALGLLGIWLLALVIIPHDSFHESQIWIPAIRGNRTTYMHISSTFQVAALLL